MSLYIVATPIGNLEDITLRALRVLKEVDMVLCEDTRESGKLLSKYEIKKPLKSFHAQSKLSRTDEIIDLLKEGKNLALITDAGTPAISDPGSLLVKKVREEIPEVEVVVIPGASALTAAFAGSGITGGEFVFLGFLPHKKGRETLFKEIAEAKRPYIFYESPHRIMKTLESLQKFTPQKNITLGRELTKKFEEFLSGRATELLQTLSENTEKQKGEFVVLVD